MVRVRTVSFPRILRHALAHQEQVHGRAGVGKLVVKFDLEGAEYDLLPGLVDQKLFCAIHSGSIEWHPAGHGMRDEQERREQIRKGVLKAASDCGVDLRSIDDEYLARLGVGPSFPNQTVCVGARPSPVAALTSPLMHSADATLAMHANVSEQKELKMEHLLPAALTRTKPLLLDSRALHSAAKALFRSVREDRFRVYLDDACSMPAQWRNTSLNFKRDNKYGADVLLPLMLEKSPFVTADWQRANASLVVLHVRSYGGAYLGPERCRRALAARSAAWQATNGSRHFFVLTSDFGPCSHQGALVLPKLMQHHIIAVHGEREGHHWRHGLAPDLPCFDPSKDISIPPLVFKLPNASAVREEEGLLQRGERARRRDLLIFFSGSGLLQGQKRQGRQTMLRLWGNNSDPEVVVHRYLPQEQMMDGFERAKFCPIFGGNSPWSTRLVEAVWSGCVPVFFSSWLPPFSRIVDWERCSVRIETLDEVANIKAILQRQPYRRLKAHLGHVKDALWYDNTGTYRGDGMLPLLLVEMHLVLQAAKQRPLALRAEEVLGLPMDLAFFDDDVQSRQYTSRPRGFTSKIRGAGAHSGVGRLPVPVQRTIERAPTVFGSHFRGGTTVVTNRTAAGPIVFRCVPITSYGHSLHVMDPYNYSELGGFGQPEPGEGDAVLSLIHTGMCAYVGPTRIKKPLFEPISPTQEPQNRDTIVANRLWLG